MLQHIICKQFMENTMSEHGAALQTFNQELVKCIEELKVKRNEIVDIIYKEEAEKVVLEKNLATVQNKLALLNKNLEYYKSIYDGYDKTIKETENGFKKILESSETLLRLAQQKAGKLENSNNLKKDDGSSL